MSEYSRLILLTSMAVVIAISISIYCFFHWQEWQEEKDILQTITHELDDSLNRSQSLDDRQQERLHLLSRTQGWSSIDLFQPEHWLSELQRLVSGSTSVNDFSARLLVEKQTTLSERNGQVLIVTPLDFELTTVDPKLAVSLIARLGQSIGSYTSVEYCRLKRLENLSSKGQFKLQCRIRKIAYKEVAL